MLKFRSEIDALNSHGMDIDSFNADMKSYLGYLVEINKNGTSPHNKSKAYFDYTLKCNIVTSSDRNFFQH